MNNQFELGTPLNIQWHFKRPDGENYSLSGQLPRLYCINARGRFLVPSVVMNAEGGYLSFTLTANMQVCSGEYSFLLQLSQNNTRVNDIIYRDAVTLMRQRTAVSIQDAGEGNVTPNSSATDGSSTPTIQLFTVGEFNLYTPTAPVGGADGYWYFNGQRIKNETEEDIASYFSLKFTREGENRGRITIYKGNADVDVEPVVVDTFDAVKVALDTVDYEMDPDNDGQEQGDHESWAHKVDVKWKEQIDDWGERAQADHERAGEDSQQAATDHNRADTDHTRANEDSGRASNDHTQAVSDSSRAAQDHAQAVSDSERAASDHTRANADSSRATQDHTQAVSDSERAAVDHAARQEDVAAANQAAANANAARAALVGSTGAVNVNLVTEHEEAYSDAATARGAVPAAVKQPGLKITYLLVDGWYSDQFIGDDIDDWSDASKWQETGPVSVSRNTLSIGGEPKGLLSSSILMTAPSDDIFANINTSDMTISILLHGGSMVIGNKARPAPEYESRTLSLLGINGYAIAITYDLSDNMLRAEDYREVPTERLVIAMIRTDEPITPTSIIGVNAPFPVSIDGKYPYANYETLSQQSGKTLFGVGNNNGKADIPNIDSINMTFSLPSSGGVMLFGNHVVGLPYENRTISLKGVSSVVILVCYDYDNRKLSVKPHNATLGLKDTVLAVIRTDAENEPTKIIGISCPFEYTLDGKTNEQRISDIIEDKINTPVYPYMSILKSILATEINTEFQSMCKVGNEFWIATGGSGAGSTILEGYIHRYNAQWEYIDKMEQHGFHFNSMDYDADTDRLITGEAGEGSNEVYIFGNVSQWPTTHSSTPITSADIERVIVVSQVNNRPNPVWAERNALGHREMIISANLNTWFIKIKLGYGTNQLQYGVYTASSTNVPNGTYAIDWNYALTIPELINQIGRQLPYSATVCQDIAYYKGKIYTMTGAVPTTIMELTITDGGLTPRVIHQLWGDDSGNVIPNCANEGIICKDGKIYCGISAIGMDTQITQYNNKIMEFDM